MRRNRMPARVLGIMSGTSLDGVDCALCAVAPRRIELLDLWAVRFPRRLRERLERAARGQAGSWEVGQLHHDLGRFYAQAASSHPTPAARRPELIGLHGQTIFHHPHPRHPASLQMGEPAYLAEAMRVPVVSNFRAADLAAGGQGAPLATLFHLRVFGREGRHVCVNNLGGISNVTSIDRRSGRAPRVRSFDTGPGNLLIDMLARKLSGGRRSFDRDGAGAAAGKPCEGLLRVWLRHPFFARRPPKSTGRELFGERFLDRVWPQMRAARLSSTDMLATVTELTARSLVLNYRRHVRPIPDQVILAGGGAANRHLRGRIESGLRGLNPAIRIGATEEYGWPCLSIEAAAFSLLAWLRVRGEPGNLPETTGARHALCLGVVGG